MDFLKDTKNAPLVIVVVVLAIGGAVASCVHFLSPQPVPQIVRSNVPPPNYNEPETRPQSSQPATP